MRKHWCFARRQRRCERRRRRTRRRLGGVNGGDASRGALEADCNGVIETAAVIWLTHTAFGRLVIWSVIDFCCSRNLCSMAVALRQHLKMLLSSLVPLLVTRPGGLNHYGASSYRSYCMRLVVT